MKTKSKKQVGQSALTRVRKIFPNVKYVVDADESINIEVIPEDARSGRKKDPEACALARACIRQKIADHAIIGIGFSYLIKGNTATRYKTSSAVGREITSFDRHQDFAAGRDYKLSRISPRARLGEHPGPSSDGPRLTKKPNPNVHVHRTANIRVR